MKAKDLIGKIATRTAGMECPNGNKDNSFMGAKMLILQATDDIIICKDLRSMFNDLNPFTLDKRWCDDNWIDISDILEAADKELAAFEAKFRIKKQIIQEKDGTFLVTGLSKTEQKVLPAWLVNSEDNTHENKHPGKIGWGKWTKWTLSNGETVFMLECMNLRSVRETIVEFATEILGCEHIIQEDEE